MAILGFGGVVAKKKKKKKIIKKDWSLWHTVLANFWVSTPEARQCFRKTRCSRAEVHTDTDLLDQVAQPRGKIFTNRNDLITHLNLRGGL